MLNDKQRSELSYIAFCKYEIFERKTFKKWWKAILKDLITMLEAICLLIKGLLYIPANIIMFIIFPLGLFVGWMFLKVDIAKRKKENIVRC